MGHGRRVVLLSNCATVLASALATALVLVVALPVAAPRAATVTFADGLLHTVPGDPAFADYDRVILTNGSSLLALPPAVVSGASISGACATDVIGETGLQVDPGSSATVEGLGALFSSDSIDCIADATVPLPGVHVASGTAVDLRGTLLVRNEVVSGIAASRVLNSTLGITRTQATSGIAVHLRDGSARVESGLILGGNVIAQGGAIDNIATKQPAILVEPSGQLEIEGGQTGAGSLLARSFPADNGNAQAFGPPSIVIRHSATVVVRGGEIYGSGAVARAGSRGGDAFASAGPAFLIHDGAAVTIYGGRIESGEATATASVFGTAATELAPKIRIQVEGNSSVNRLVILGGTFGPGTLLDIPFTPNTPAPSPRLAHVEIAGGTFDTTGGVGLRLSHPDVVTVLYMTNHAVDGIPGADPMSFTSGTLTGQLVDGSPVSLTFERSNGAPLGVPEPRFALPIALLGLALLGRREPLRHPAAPVRL